MALDMSCCGVIIESSAAETCRWLIKDITQCEGRRKVRMVEINTDRETARFRSDQLPTNKRAVISAKAQETWTHASCGVLINAHTRPCLLSGATKELFSPQLVSGSHLCMFCSLSASITALLFFFLVMIFVFSCQSEYTLIGSNADVP